MTSGNLAQNDRIGFGIHVEGENVEVEFWGGEEAEAEAEEEEGSVDMLGVYFGVYVCETA